MFQLDNVKNEAILRDFLNFRRWRSKTKQFCETSSIFEVENTKSEANLGDFLPKWKAECRADGPVPMRFAKVLRLPRKSDASKIILANLKVLQNGTFFRKSVPWPPNISYEHVSCIVPATQNASFQILFKCPTPANTFESATKLSRFAHFLHGAESLAPATQDHIWTFKSGPSILCF